MRPELRALVLAGMAALSSMSTMSAEERALLAMVPEGRTALYDAALAGLSRLEEGSRARKVLIVMSDADERRWRPAPSAAMLVAGMADHTGRRRAGMLLLWVARRSHIRARACGRRASGRQRDGAWRGRRGAILRALPLAGIPVGSLSVPDAGSPIRTEPPGSEGMAATDRPLISAMPFGVGIVDLPVALDSPRAEGEEPLDLIEIEAAPPPGPPPGRELLADPRGRGFEHAMPGQKAKYRRARGALYYGNGDAGARHGRPVCVGHVRIWGSYARHQADIAPLNHAKGRATPWRRPPARPGSTRSGSARDGVEHRRRASDQPTFGIQAIGRAEISRLRSSPRSGGSDFERVDSRTRRANECACCTLGNRPACRLVDRSAIRERSPS